MMKMGSIGDNVVDRYLDTGMMFPGGGAANVAVHASRFGCDTVYIGLIGSDSAGEHVRAALSEEGVDIASTRRLEEPNAMTDVSLDERGNRRFEAHRPMESPLELTEDDLACLDGCTWLYTSYSSGTESQVPALAAIAPLAYDFSYKAEDYAAPLLPSVTIAAFSRDWMGIEQAEQFIRAVQEQGPETVIVTRGSQGAVIGCGDVVHVQPAESIVPIDTLGAGDAFLARFVSGMYSGESVAVASASASAWAAAACLHYGAFGHPRPIPTETEETLHVSRS